jgi:G:T-mismatch repair DNA endonuclease (very short patch repair protein)
MKPDGFDPPVSGDTHKGTVWQYHGTHFHGYPPDHPDHETYVHNGKWGPDCYHDTVKKMQLYKNAGYRVKYVWSCDYVQTTCKGPRPLAEVIRDF